MSYGCFDIKLNIVTITAPLSDCRTPSLNDLLCHVTREPSDSAINEIIVDCCISILSRVTIQVGGTQ